jgi:hypothetical protein
LWFCGLGKPRGCPVTPTEFLDQIAGSPRAARELIQRLSQRLREEDDRIVNDERRSRPAHGTRKDADSQTAVELVNNAYLAAKTPWLQRQLQAPLGLGDLPFIVGRGPVAGERPPRLQPDLKLDDTVLQCAETRECGQAIVLARESRPRAMPKYGVAAFPTIWWRDARRVAKLSGSDG